VDNFNLSLCYNAFMSFWVFTGSGYKSYVSKKIYRGVMLQSFKHGSRHRTSQMKAIIRGRFKGRGARFGL